VDEFIFFITTFLPSFLPSFFFFHPAFPFFRKKKVQREKKINENMQNEETRDEEDEIKSESKTSKHINIKVVNSEGNEVFFKIKKNTKLRKLMDAYCKRQGLVNGSVRFSFDGNRVNPETTPDDIGIQSDDIIDAMVEQTGGQRYYHCWNSWY